MTQGAGRSRFATALSLALLLAACQTATPAGPSSQPVSGTPSGSQSTSPGTPGPLPTNAPTDDPTTRPLPEPQLGSIDAIVQALPNPDMAEQVVVSMLDQLGIGLYKTDGARIRAGTETTDADFFVFEPEARGLAEMLRHRDDPAESISLRDLHAGLVGLGFAGTAEDLARAYTEAYAAEPDAPLSQLVTPLTRLDVDAQLPAFAAWLLVLDGFVPPNGATTAVAFAGAIGPVAAGHAGWGTARGRLQGSSSGLHPSVARTIELLLALTHSWSVQVGATPDAVHEGHGKLGDPAQFLAFADATARQFISPLTGHLMLPADYGGAGINGIGISWRPDAVTSRHGSLAVPSTTVDKLGNGRATLTPKQEDANGQGFELSEEGCVDATILRAELLTRLYGSWVAAFAPLVRGNVRGSACLTIDWHEKLTAIVTILWTDVYDGVKDTITFEGNLTTIDPNAVGGATIYLGEGTASGDRRGWKACNPGIDVVPSGTGDATFTGEVKNGTITIGAFANFDSPLQGIVTAAFTVSLDGGTATLPPTLPVGELCPHYSYGTMMVQGLILPKH